MSASNLIRGRVPGQSIMSEIVMVQRTRRRRSGLARFFGLSPLAPSSRQLYTSALGELLVGDALDSIGPEWDVLHVVPVDDSSRHIDHLVIGPPGVFTLWSKNFPRQEVVVDGEIMTAGGHAVDDIAEARAQAASASVLLSEAAGYAIDIEPVIVVVDPRKLIIRRQPSDVTVVSSRQLLRWLTHLDRRMDGAEVAYVSDVSDQETTWHLPEEPVQDAQELHNDFAALREEVANAAFVRLAWGLAAFVVVAAFAWTAAALLGQHLVR
jgi:hypothetical protein